MRSSDTPALSFDQFARTPHGLPERACPARWAALLMDNSRHKFVTSDGIDRPFKALVKNAAVPFQAFRKADRRQQLLMLVLTGMATAVITLAAFQFKKRVS